jgi:hypothetical protein
MQAFLKLATSGPSSRDISSALVSIDRPCSEYSGKTTRSIVDMPLRAFAAIAQIFLVCAARSLLVAMVGNCSCTNPITTPSGVLFNPPSPLIRSLHLRAWLPGAANLHNSATAVPPIFAIDQFIAPPPRFRSGLGWFLCV